MFERFNEGARQAVVLAQAQARELGGSYVGAEHLLLGLLHVKEGIAAQALENLGATCEPVRAEIVSLAGPGEEIHAGQLPFTPDAKKALEHALREALGLHHDHIGTEHILLGLTREHDNLAISVLLALGADATKIREEVTRLLPIPRPAASSGKAPTARAGTGVDPGLEQRLETIRREHEAAIGTQELAKATALGVLERRLSERKRQIDELDAELHSTRREKEQAIAEQQFERAAALRTREHRLLDRRCELEEQWLREADAGSSGVARQPSSGADAGTPSEIAIEQIMATIQSLS
ncbi:MAG TPA: Clp protease N-terminal domain-containing protein [Solirubrobacteraceae bacterium]|nr:Clp protease N-terminal domain-containing protein [Solirubrobacteraceae bacterium]